MSVKLIFMTVQVIIGVDFMKLMHFSFILILMLLVVSVNATYIDEISTDNIKDIQYYGNDSAVSLDGFNFTIPEGFGPIENESVNMANGNYTQSERFFANEDGDTIMISTTSILRHDLILSDYAPCDVNMDKKVINGHEGIEWSMNNGTYFIYFDDNYLITVGASNSSYFEDIIF